MKSELSQFSKDEIIVVLEQFIGKEKTNLAYLSVFHFLHSLKYNRLIKNYNSMVEVHENKYEKYREKGIPQSRYKEYKAFDAKFKRLATELAKQELLLAVAKKKLQKRDQK